MKILKNKILFWIFIILFAGFSACNPDDDDTSGSGTYTPETFVGNWNCVENSQNMGSSSYIITINRSQTANNHLWVDNFYHLGVGFQVTMVLNGSNINIPQQIVGTYTFSGNGTVINSNRVNLSFMADDGGGIADAVSATLSR
jgi:hypothetical protein